MPMKDNFLAAKKVAMALHSLISTQYPRDFLGLVVFSEVARTLLPAELPRVSWDFVFGTNIQHALLLARRMLARQAGTKQVLMITDGEPTAHILPDGEPFFSYPPARETVEATLAEVMRCTAEGICINTFMLDADPSLQAFVERVRTTQPGQGVLHHAGDPRQLRPGRLPRAEAGLPGPLGLTVSCRFYGLTVSSPGG